MKSVSALYGSSPRVIVEERKCRLHDTGLSFIAIRLYPGSILKTMCLQKRVILQMSSPR